MTESVAVSDSTMQWRSGELTSAPVLADGASTPAGLHPPMSREQYGQATTSPHSRKGRNLLIAAVLLALLAGGLTWYFADLRYVDTPVLTGSAETVAQKNAEAAGFRFTVDSRKFSESDPLGTVISTSPRPGRKILPGGTIEAVVSKGPDRVSIPAGNLEGLTIAEAAAALAKEDLVLGDQKETYSESIPAGKVVKADGVTSADVLKRGDKVDVRVSRGRRPIPVTSYVGRPIDEATSGLESAGFKVASSKAFSDTVADGLVISQDPSSGDKFRDDTITLSVSKGPEQIDIPSVLGMPRAQAEQTLVAAGFTTRVFGGNGVVLLQPDKKGRRGSQVTIYTSP